MSAPVLSPTERDETTRFGIHDPETFADIVEHYDEVIPCTAAECDTAATAVVSMRCCGFQWFTCDPHLVHGKKETGDFLLKLLLRGLHPTCVRCSHTFEFGAMFDDVYRVVTL